MTYWKCPECFWTKETKEGIVFVACSCCLTEMEKLREMENEKRGNTKNN